jgi:hypothetical protein
VLADLRGKCVCIYIYIYRFYRERSALQNVDWLLRVRELKPGGSYTQVYALEIGGGGGERADSTLRLLLFVGKREWCRFCENVKNWVEKIVYFLMVCIRKAIWYTSQLRVAVNVWFHKAKWRNTNIPHRNWNAFVSPYASLWSLSSATNRNTNFYEYALN